MTRTGKGTFLDPESEGLPFTSAQLPELVDAFCAMPFMNDPDYRQLYVDQLPASITANLARFSDARHDVHSIVVACLRHPGGVRAFIAVLRQFQPHGPELARLEDLVEVLLPESFLDAGEEAELHHLMGRVSWAQVAAVYRDPVAIAGADLSAVWGDAIAVCRQLALFGEPPGMVPKLLDFVDQVAHQVGGLTKAELHRWVDTVADRIGCSQRVRDLCGPAERRSQSAGRYFLVIRLEPDGAGRDMFLVGSWLQGSDGVLQRLEYTVRPRARAELPGDVERWLAQVPGLASTRVDDLVVEFVVPRSLMTEPVDQWRVKVGTFPAPLGVTFPVVLRSGDRIKAALTHQAWRRKWRLALLNGEAYEERSVRWLRERGTLTMVQLHALIMRHEHEVCVVMGFPPDQPADQVEDEIEAALAAGAPALLWIRDPTLAPGLDDELRPLLAQSGVARLPELVLRLRREAAASEAPQGHVGSVLSLLWDDADRVPDLPELVLADQPFTSPTEEGNLAT